MTLTSLIKSVQTNCDISDAQYAQEFPLCIYLLKMRDYYRWKNQLAINAVLDKQALGEWIVQLEELWQNLDFNDFININIDNKKLAPFDLDKINPLLQKYNLYYGAGYGVAGKPQFFLADVIETEQVGSHTVYTLGKEYARNLFAYPAMLQDHLIIIRQDALTRYIAEKIEEWQWRKSESAMSHALEFYDFENNFDKALTQMATHELAVIKYHELGELMAGAHLGQEWRKMLSEISNARTERIVRAIKDHIADCMRTLPELIDKEDIASIHFYMANFEGFRKQLWPALMTSYQKAMEKNNLMLLNQSITQGLEYWCDAGEKILQLYETAEPENLKSINKFVEQIKLAA